MHDFTPVACDFVTTPRRGGKYEHRCRVCGTLRVTNRPKHVRECVPSTRQIHVNRHGPGDHLHTLIAKYFGERATLSCGCGAKIDEMNQLGPAGVRERIDEYAAWIGEQADKQGWWDQQPDGRRLRWWKFLSGLPGRSQAIKMLIRHACRLAERDAAKHPPVDVIYAIGPGSVWDDNELRYSLRSLQKYAQNLGRVFVVGEKPEWLTGVEHIPMDDAYKCNKDANLIDKVRAAIAGGCSERFIFASDDQCLLAPTWLSGLPAYYSGDLTTKQDWGEGKWWARMKATRDYLTAKGLSTRNYDTHVFQPHSAKEFERVASEAPYGDGAGLCINTLAINGNPKAETSPISGTKLSIENDGWDAEKIRQGAIGKIHLGYNNAGLTPALKQFLTERFPEKSRFETEDIPRPTPIMADPANTTRGIVTLAGGPVYSLNAYINCRMLRQLGCTLPIEWCYLGDELSIGWLDLIERTIPDVRMVDLGGERKDNAKRKGGWQAKVEAVLQSQFGELLFLDADCFPLRDPAPLFDHPFFRNHDCVFWPDIRDWRPAERANIQEKHGVTVQGRQVESGQMMFHKAACIEGLLAARAMNQNSGTVYKYLHGDKDTFLIGALQAGVNYAINPHLVTKCCQQRNLAQHDFDGQRIFCHVTRDKWRPKQPAVLNEEYYPPYKQAVAVFNEIRHDNAMMETIRTEVNMRVRDSFCAAEAAHIINEDMYKIRPMIEHRVPVRYIVDIGGNAGAFTVAASAAYPESEIIVVEPDPELMADIRYNTRDCKAKIHYVEKACVGTDRESVAFVRTADSRGSGFVKESSWGATKETTADDAEFTVPATTLPKLLEEFGFSSVDILKIDAEGVEGEILASLKETGWLLRVHWIRGEWHGQSDKRKIETALRETHVCTLQPSPANGELIAHNREDA